MKKTITSISIIILMISCIDKKNTTTEKGLVTKTDSIAVAKSISFEQELLLKSKLPDTLAMAAYRTSGRFIGVDQLKDTITIQIDVEAQKVTGTLSQQIKGKTIDSVFAGTIKNNAITPAKGLSKSSIFIILGNNLTFKRGDQIIVLKLT